VSLAHRPTSNSLAGSGGFIVVIDNIFTERARKLREGFSVGKNIGADQACTDPEQITRGEIRIGVLRPTPTPDPVDLRPGRETNALVPIVELLPADSPRLGGENMEYVRMLAEVADPLPPIMVHRPTMRVIDGMHRLRAAILRGEETIEARFFDGQEFEGFVLGVRANMAHGLPLTLADRLAAAARIVAACPYWSDRAVAAVAGLSPKTVMAVRGRSTEEIPQSNSRIGMDGRVRSSNVSEGRRRAAELLSRRPDTSLRELAREAGISVGTAWDVRLRLTRGEDAVIPTQRPVPATGPEQKNVRPGQGDQAVHPWRTLEVLRKDPSLRSTELGRALLRLLDMHRIDADGWTRLVERVPVYCAPAVADIARHCAEIWRDCADQLDRLGQTIG
jgi:hypothetical protein